MLHRVYESAKITDEYIRYRPKYSSEVRDVVVDYLQKDKSDSDNKCELMVEVGCGSGQATNLFAPYFNRVYATDISEAQIERAKRQNNFTNVVYEIGCAEELVGVENQSVDLLMSASCAHWFDLPRFFAEASRVLKPEGCLAIMAYYDPTLIPYLEHTKQFSQELSDLLNFYICHGKCHNLRAYDELKLGYKNIFNAIPGQQKEKQVVKMEESWSLASAKGFMRSTDAYQLYMKRIIDTFGENMTKEDLAELDSAEIFQRKVVALLKTPDASVDDILFRAVFSCTILLSKTPILYTEE